MSTISRAGMRQHRHHRVISGLKKPTSWVKTEGKGTLLHVVVTMEKAMCGSHGVQSRGKTEREGDVTSLGSDTA